MKRPVRTPLTPEQIAEAQRLREIYQLRVSESRARGDKPALNQTEVGERCEWKSPQSTVSQYLNGALALNLEALIRLAKVLDFEPASVSPRLAGEIRRGAPENEAEQEDHSSELIPVTTAKAAAGLGYVNTHIERRDQWPFKRSWLKANSLKPESLVIITADGESMQPTIFDQDKILVDLSRKEPENGHVFVLNSPAEGVIVKRIYATGFGGWVISSDNPDKEQFPNRYPRKDDGTDMQIVGLVVWRGGEI